MGRLLNSNALAGGHGLAATSVFATGLVSYAVALNRTSQRRCSCWPRRMSGPSGRQQSAIARRRMLVLAGFCAALAATIDLAAVAFLFLLVIVIASMRLGSAASSRWRDSLRARWRMPPLLLHATLVTPLTGGLCRALLYPNWPPAAARYFWTTPPARLTKARISSPPRPIWEMSRTQPHHRLAHHRGGTSLVLSAAGRRARLAGAFSDRGPGIVGMFAVMHRNWPTTTKVLAADSPWR